MSQPKTVEAKKPPPPATPSAFRRLLRADARRYCLVTIGHLRPPEADCTPCGDRLPTTSCITTSID